MRKYLLLAAVCTTTAHADIVETIEKYTDIFGVSVSNSDGETVYTLDANYEINDQVRIFGDIDTDSNWEAGFGYSIWSGESYYTENTIKISDRKYSTGIFVAKAINENWLAVGDVNYNYNLETDDPACEWFESCNGNPLELSYQPASSVDYSVGMMWSPFDVTDLMYKFNHEVGIDKNYFYSGNDRLDITASRTNFHYHEFIVYLNVKYVRPSITYTYMEDGRDYIEFGLTFNF